MGCSVLRVDVNGFFAVNKRVRQLTHFDKCAGTISVCRDIAWIESESESVQGNDILPLLANEFFITPRQQLGHPFGNVCRADPIKLLRITTSRLIIEIAGMPIIGPGLIDPAIQLKGMTTIGIAQWIMVIQ